LNGPLRGKNPHVRSADPRENSGVASRAEGMGRSLTGGHVKDGDGHRIHGAKPHEIG